MYKRQDGGDGLVAVGETDMTVRPERIAGLKFPVVVHFNPVSYTHLTLPTSDLV